MSNCKPFPRGLRNALLSAMNETIKSHFLVLYCMMLADGIIDVEELKTIYRIGTENYDLTPDEISLCIKESGTSFDLPQNLTDKISLLYELALIAWADGRIEDAEINILRKYALNMGFLETNIETIIEFLLNEAKENKPVATVIETILNS